MYSAEYKVVDGTDSAVGRVHEQLKAMTASWGLVRRQDAGYSNATEAEYVRSAALC